MSSNKVTFRNNYLVYKNENTFMNFYGTAELLEELKEVDIKAREVFGNIVWTWESGKLRSRQNIKRIT